jgi:N-acetylmuramoyl-L-alanine amidase
VNQSRTQTFLGATALFFCGLIPASLQAQPPALSRAIIVLDPAHGGDDIGAHIADNLTEKDLTLAFAGRLRPLLAAAGFTTVATRDADPALGNILDPDQRAGLANHPRALACILIHATPSGSGVHIYTSALPANSESLDSNQVPWDSAQSAYLPLSVRLAARLGIALLHVNIPALLGHASIRPLDNLTCPAVAIELAPLTVPDSDPTPVTDATYQQHIAQAIVTALISWRNNAAPPSTQPATPTPKSPPQPAAKPATKPTPPPPDTHPASPQPPVKPAPTPAPTPGAAQ